MPPLSLFAIVLISSLTLSSTSPLPKRIERFDVRSFGAIADGKTINTESFTRCVAAAVAKVSSGQVQVATVFVPSTGVFVTGSFALSSNVYLELEEGAEIYASDDAKEYKCVPSMTSDTGPCDYPLVYAINATNTGIISSSSLLYENGNNSPSEKKGGSINGGANSPPGHLVDRYDPSSNFLIPTGWTFPECSGYACRPKLVLFVRCSALRVQDVSLLNSPLWTMTLVESNDVLVDGVTIKGDRRWPNNDGIDPISSFDIVVKNSWIEAGDDAIAIITHTPTDIRNITVQDSVLISTSAAIKLSAFDANATGSIYDLSFSNIRILDTNRGICIDPRWGSGTIGNVIFQNLTIETKFFSDSWWGAGEPIYITSMSESETQKWTGRIENMQFIDIQARSENGVVVFGQNLPVRNVSFEHVDVTIGVFGNLSRPVHDWRPAPSPDETFALIDGFYLEGIEDGSLINCRVEFDQGESQKQQHYWGECVNATVTAQVKQQGIKCVW